MPGEGHADFDVQPPQPHSLHLGCFPLNRVLGVCPGSPLIGCLEECFSGHWPMHLET